MQHKVAAVAGVGRFLNAGHRVWAIGFGIINGVGGVIGFSLEHSTGIGPRLCE
jgi:hypothetical protein